MSGLLSTGLSVIHCLQVTEFYPRYTQQGYKMQQ